MELKYIQNHLNEWSLVENLPNMDFVKTYICEFKGSVFLYKDFSFPLGQKLFYREIRASKALSDTDSVLKLLEDSETAISGAALFDFTNQQSLSGLLLQQVPLNPHLLFANLLKALSKLHSLSYLHRNLSLHNIFVTKNLSVRLGGLDSAITIEEIEDLYGVELSEDIENSTEASTRPPELLDLLPGLNITTQTDMWGLGCVIYEVLYHKKPFIDMPHQIRGEFIDIPQGFWKLVIKRLLTVDPRQRSNCKDLLNVVVISMSEKKQVKKSLFAGFFANSTKSWVKALVKNKDSPIKLEVFEKLVNKAKKKPQKIRKFYKQLMASALYMPKTCLKSLLLLHKYMNSGPLAVITQSIQSFLTCASSLWLNPKNKDLQKYFSESSQSAILEYCKILEKKYTLHKLLPGNWKDLEISDKFLLLDVVEYYSALGKYAFFLFDLRGFDSICNDVIGTILQEQQRIANAILACIKEANDMRLREDFEEFYNKHLENVRKYYVKYPLSELLPEEVQVENVYKMRRNTLMVRNAKYDPLEVSKEPEVQKTFTNHPLLITADELEFEEIIGIGGSCTVYRGKYKNLEVAIKVMKKTSNNTYLKEFNREVQMLSTLHHANLVSLIGSCIGERMCIVMEYCKGSTLFELLHEKKNIRLSWKQRISFAKDIAAGMAYLHSRVPAVIHRDLKSLNVLLSDPVSSLKDFPVLKINDFGVARDSTTEKMTGMMGTCHWMSPEVLSDSLYSLPADVYSFGIVLWELLSRETPYHDILPTIIPHQVVNEGKRPDIEQIKDSCPTELKNLMLACWAHKPNDRPTFAQISEILSYLDISNSL